MKKVLSFLSLLTFILATDYRASYPYCPSVNVGRSDGVVNCPGEASAQIGGTESTTLNYGSDHYYCKPLFDNDGDYLYGLLYGDYYDKFYSIDEEVDATDCFSQHLYNRKSGNKASYYNKCCYLVFHAQGKKYNHCVGLTDEQMMDVPLTIKDLENEFSDKTGSYMYIETLNCKGEYLFYSMIGALLLALIF